MGKGYAWVNGQSLGRTWPSYDADEDGCSDDPCDYRGEYSDTKCVLPIVASPHRDGLLTC